MDSTQSHETVRLKFSIVDPNNSKYFVQALLQLPSNYQITLEMLRVDKYSNVLQTIVQTRDPNKVQLELQIWQSTQQLGSATVPLAEVLSGPDSCYSLATFDAAKKPLAKILIYYAYIQIDSSYLQISFAAEIPNRSGCFSLCCQKPLRPVIEILAHEPERQLYKAPSGQQVNQQSYEWPISILKARTLINGNYDQIFTLKVFDEQPSRAPRLIGQASITLATILNKTSSSVHLEHEGQNKGSVALKHQFHLLTPLEDYTTRGLELNLMMGIDFTESNGDPRLSSSLHYLDPSWQTQSQYEKVLRNFCRLIQNYGFRLKVALYGFGLSPQQGDPTNHCYKLKQTGQDFEEIELVELANIYRKTAQVVKFGGPSLFCPIVKKAKGFAKEFKFSHSQYLALIILTDGEILDPEQTEEQLSEILLLPLSIFVIGIGPEGKFEALKEFCNGSNIFFRLQKPDGEKNLAQEIMAQLQDCVLKYYKDQNIDAFKLPGIFKILKENVGVSSNQIFIQKNLDKQNSRNLQYPQG